MHPRAGLDSAHHLFGIGGHIALILRLPRRSDFFCDQAALGKHLHYNPAFDQDDDDPASPPPGHGYLDVRPARAALIGGGSILPA